MNMSAVIIVNADFQVVELRLAAPENRVVIRPSLQLGICVEQISEPQLEVGSVAKRSMAGDFCKEPFGLCCVAHVSLGNTYTMYPC